MKASIEWIEEVTFQAQSGSGHTVTIDGPPSAGGGNAGPRPMELMLMGMGGCASFDVMQILKKARQPVERCVTRIDATRADGIPGVFTDVHLHFIITGAGVSESRVKRAIELSAEKYCSAAIMLSRGGVNITHDYELVAS